MTLLNLQSDTPLYAPIGPLAVTACRARCEEVEGTHLLGHGPDHFTMYKRNVQIVPSQVMRERTNSEHS